MDGAEGEAKGAVLGMDLWSYTGFPAHRIPWNPTAVEMEVPAPPATADWSCSALLLSGFLPVPRGTKRYGEKRSRFIPKRGQMSRASQN